VLEVLEAALAFKFELVGLIFVFDLDRDDELHINIKLLSGAAHQPSVFVYAADCREQEVHLACDVGFCDPDFVVGLEDNIVHEPSISFDLLGLVYLLHAIS